MATNLPTSHAKQAANFLKKVQAGPHGRICFVIDATESRGPTWDHAAQLQAEMFAESARLGGLEMQVVCFRGFDKVEASNWTIDARELQHWMGRIRCESGHTKYARAPARGRPEE